MREPSAEDTLVRRVNETVHQTCEGNVTERKEFPRTTSKANSDGAEIQDPIINSDGESDQSDFPCDGKQELADGKIFRNWFRRDEMGDPFVSPALGVTSLRVWGFREIEFGKDYLGTTYSEMFLTQSDKRIKTYVRTLHTLLQGDKAQRRTRKAMMDFVDYASARLGRDGSTNKKSPKRRRKST